MSLLRYIKGLRRGKGAHHIELEAMKDFFLSEALDGYDSIEDNHLKRISRLQKNVKNHVLNKNKTVAAKPKTKAETTKIAIIIPWKKLSIAATLFLCLSLGGYYFYENYERFSPSRLFALFEFQKKTENMASKQDTIVIFGQDTIIIYMPPPLPKKDLIASAQTLQEELKNTERDIEIVKLEASQIQLLTDNIGFEHKELSPPYTDKPVMIAMNESIHSLDEVVVAGSVPQKRITLTASVSTQVEEEKLRTNQEKSIKPEPEIGMNAYKNYLKTNVIQPTDSACKDIKGKVKLRFFVNQEGNPHNIQVTKSLCKTADAEAIRLVQSGGRWKYGNEAVEIEVSF